MKWVIFLALLVQRNCISQSTSENVRESRQLKFNDCCPCPAMDRIQDNNVLGTNNVPSDCPCRAADSETAASVFTPTLKAVQSFVRPFESKDEPKPLLNPEVGLASSVLETLREVTDLEYQEALARDVARSALQVLDSDAVITPLSESKNMFNDVLSPRSKEAIDAIPQASSNEETLCIPPLLKRTNEYDGHFDKQPQRYLFKDFLLGKPGGLHKNNNDMAYSPSNVQENTLLAKNNFLDDIKTNLLKLKLFPKNKELSQRITDKSFAKKYNNNNEHERTDWKFVPPLDNLKTSKLFDSNSSPEVVGRATDSLLNNNLSKKKAQNDKNVILAAKLRKSQQINKYVTDERSSETNNFAVPKEFQHNKNTKDYGKDSNADTSVLNPVLSIREDSQLKKENKGQVETTTEKIYNTVVTDTSDFPMFIPSHNGTEILDTLPSPSEMITDDNNIIHSYDSSPHEDNNIENVSEINVEPHSNKNTPNTYEANNPTSIVKPTALEETTNNLSIEDNIEEADKYMPEFVCPPEKTKDEISSYYVVSTPEPIVINTDVFNVPINQNEEGDINFMIEGNNLVDKSKEKNFKIFPNLGESLIKTYENVKNFNEKLQENFKLKVQDALQFVDIKNNIVMQEEPKQNPVYVPEILDTVHKSNSKSSTAPSNTLSSHELQSMSDSILTLSSVNPNSDPNQGSLSKGFKEGLQEIDSNSETSMTISCLTPADVSNIKSEKKSLNNNNKEIIKSGSENHQYFRNLNTEKSENPIEKFSLNMKGATTDRFDENEMAAQASEPKSQRNTKFGQDNSRFLKQSLVVQPNNELDEFGTSLSNVNNFFENVKSTFSDVLDKTNENIFRQTKGNEDEIGDNYKRNEKDRAFNREKPKNNLKSAKLLKSPETIKTDYSTEKFKANLNPYKARVAVPASFDVKAILTPGENIDKRSRTLNNPRNILPKTYSTEAFGYNSDEYLGNENLRSLFRETEHSYPNSESTVLSPSIFQNNFRSGSGSGSGSKNLDNLQDRTETALQNIHKTLGNPSRVVSLQKNNRFLNKNVDNENFFESMVNKRNELNEKLQAINLDFNDRLSSLSQRMAESILPQRISTTRSQPQGRIIAKNRYDDKTKQSSDYSSRINIPSDLRRRLPKSKLNAQLRQSKDNLLVPKQLKQSLVNDNLLGLKSVRVLKPTLKSSPVIKSPETEMKTFIPKLKDKKVISLITATPKTLISGLKAPQTIQKISSSVPKTSAVLDKNRFRSLGKSAEPFTLGSENIMSGVLLDKNTNKPAMDVSSDESDQKFDSNFKEVTVSKQEAARKLAVSKLREAFKTRMLNRDTNKEDLKDNNLKSRSNNQDIIPSASENVNREIDGSLKENVPYKCKLLCTKDK